MTQNSKIDVDTPDETAAEQRASAADAPTAEQDTVSDETAAPDAGQPSEGEAAAEREPAVSEPVSLEQDLKDEIARLGEENARLKDQSLRALAEAENTRRRAEREKEDTARYSISSFAKDL